MSASNAASILSMRSLPPPLGLGPRATGTDVLRFVFRSVSMAVHRSRVGLLQSVQASKRAPPCSLAARMQPQPAAGRGRAGALPPDGL